MKSGFEVRPSYSFQVVGRDNHAYINTQGQEIDKREEYSSMLQRPKSMMTTRGKSLKEESQGKLLEEQTRAEQTNVKPASIDTTQPMHKCYGSQILKHSQSNRIHFPRQRREEMVELKNELDK